VRTLTMVCALPAEQASTTTQEYKALPFEDFDHGSCLACRADFDNRETGGLALRGL
jgi:hypothetical protein